MQTVGSGTPPGDAVTLAGRRAKRTPMRWRAVALVGLLTGALGSLVIGGMAPARAVAPATFWGQVQDGVSDQPLAGARVAIGPTTVTTMATGAYSITVPAAARYAITVSAAGYVSVTLLLGAGGAIISGAQRLDIVGANGLKPLSQRLTLWGTVRDAGAGQPVPGAAVSAQGQQVVADGAGRYQLNLAAASRVEVAVTALGYGLRPPFVLSGAGRAVLQGALRLDFRGPYGLPSAFVTPAGDRLIGLRQIMPTCGTSLPFSMQAHGQLEGSFALTRPSGSAVLLPLIQVGPGRYSGQISPVGKPGVYHLEVNSVSGFPLFSDYLYCGVPYLSPLPRAVYPADARSLSPAELEARALTALNTLRASFGCPPYTLDAALSQVARAHSADVVAHGYYRDHPHLGSDGSTLTTRVRGAGLSFALLGEAMAQATSVRAGLDNMMISPGHRVQALSTVFQRVGVGVARSADGVSILTVDFLRP